MYKRQLLEEVEALTEELNGKWLDDAVVNIHYPVLKYPTKIVSLNLDKTPCISGTLEGIKGQYLLLDSGVLNLRKYSSYHLEIAI